MSSLTCHSHTLGLLWEAGRGKDTGQWHTFIVHSVDFFCISWQTSRHRKRRGSPLLLCVGTGTTLPQSPGRGGRDLVGDTVQCMFKKILCTVSQQTSHSDQEIQIQIHQIQVPAGLMLTLWHGYVFSLFPQTYPLLPSGNTPSQEHQLSWIGDKVSYTRHVFLFFRTRVLQALRWQATRTENVPSSWTRTWRVTSTHKQYRPHTGGPRTRRYLNVTRTYTHRLHVHEPTCQCCKGQRCRIPFSFPLL